MDVEYTTCNLCGSDDSIVMFQQRDSLQNTIDYEFTVVQCNKCGLVYVNPRPAFRDIGKFYPDNFVSYQLEIYDIETESTLILRQKIISTIVRNATQSRIHAIEKETKLNSNINVLDIGCGKASFLYLMNQKYGCACLGIDFDKKSVEYNKEILGINVLEGDIHTVKIPDTEFDFITMWHFLEHEYDPLATILKATRYLKDDGILVVEVPNQASLENMVFRERSYLYDVPRHLYSFSPETLTELIKKANLDIMKITYPFSAGGWLGTFQNLLSNGKVYANVQKHIFLLIVLGVLSFPFDLISNLVQRGSIMRFYVKKGMNHA